MVFVHGDFGDGFDSWSPACRLIGRRRRTVVIDRPGFGEDLLADTRFTIAARLAHCLTSWPPWACRFISSGTPMAP